MTFAKAVFIVAGRFLTWALYRVVRLQDGSKILSTIAAGRGRTGRVPRR